MGGGGGGGYYSGGSGSGIGSGGGNGNANGSIQCDCQSIRVTTPINSIQMTQLNQISVGDCLAVENQNGRLVVLKGSQVVGSLTPLEQARIIVCIEAGTVYEAKVVSKAGASCMVDVYCLK